MVSYSRQIKHHFKKSQQSGPILSLPQVFHRKDTFFFTFSQTVLGG